jgi:hypothetical protein
MAATAAAMTLPCLVENISWLLSLKLRSPVSQAAFGIPWKKPGVWLRSYAARDDGKASAIGPQGYAKAAGTAAPQITIGAGEIVQAGENQQ